jgi:hypothetical protein
MRTLKARERHRRIERDCITGELLDSSSWLRSTLLDVITLTRYQSERKIPSWAAYTMVASRSNSLGNSYKKKMRHKRNRCDMQEIYFKI